MIIYIAGPMSGKWNWNKWAFWLAEHRLKRRGHTVFNPARCIPKVRPERIRHEQYIQIDLTMLDCCDTIYMLRGWQESKGANIELNYAVEHRKMIEFEPTGSESIDHRNFAEVYARSLQAGLKQGASEDNWIARAFREAGVRAMKALGRVNNGRG